MGCSYRSQARQTFWQQGLQALGLAFALALGTARAAASAERIEFWLGPFEPAIWVEDLETLATTGEISDRLRIFASRLDDAQVQTLRTFLNTPLDVDLTTIAQVAYWQVGERFLDRMGQVVQTDNFLNGSRALRAALIAAAADGDGITPLEVLQAYPLEVVQLDFALAQQLIRENQRFFVDREAVVAALQDIALIQTSTFPTQDPTQAGEVPWRQETLSFQNPLRQGDIPVDVYLPTATTAPGTTPVVVLSHGVASDRNAFTYIARHLASHGYGVLVPQHDDDSRKYEQFLAGVDRPPNPITLVSRPQDISRVLDAVETIAQTRPDYRQLDLDNVGVLGHSLGGFTALAAAGAELNFPKVAETCSLAERNRPSLNPSLLVQCDLTDLQNQGPFSLHDDRLRAVFALSPPTSLFFGASGLAQLDIPTLMMAVTADVVVPAIPEQIEPYRWLQTQDRYLVVLENATHFTFLEGDLTEGALPLPSTLLGPDPSLGRPYLKALSLAFFNRHLLEQQEMDAVLSQPYLESLGTTPFRATIVQTLE